MLVQSLVKLSFFVSEKSDGQFSEFSAKNKKKQKNNNNRNKKQKKNNKSPPHFVVGDLIIIGTSTDCDCKASHKMAPPVRHLVYHLLNNQFANFH